MRYLIALLAITSSLLSSVQAGVINYPNLTGTNVFFNSISESSTSIPVPFANLFGTPVVSGDSLVFSPTLFQLSQVGTGTKLVDGQFSFTLVAKPGQFISGIQIVENGSYSISTPASVPGGQGAVSASVTGFATTPSNTFSGVDSFNASAISPNSVSNLPWNVNLPINFAPVSTVNFTMDNTLTVAANLAGTSASIGKSGITIRITTSNIPEPSSASIFLVLSAFRTSILSKIHEVDRLDAKQSDFF